MSIEDRQSVESRPAISRRGYRSPSDITPSDITASAFPAVKHYLPLMGLEGGTFGIEDTVGGVKFAQNGWEQVTYGLRPTHTSESSFHNLSLQQGSWNITGTTHTLVICAGVFANYYSVGIGSSITQLEMVFSSGFYLVSVISGATTVATPAVSLPSNLCVMGAVIKPGVDITGFYTDANGDYTAQAAQSMTSIASHPNYTAAGSIGGRNTLLALSGLAVLQFSNGIPPNLGESIEWIRGRALAGKFVLPPRWAGLP